MNLGKIVETKHKGKYLTDQEPSQDVHQLAETLKLKFIITKF